MSQPIRPCCEVCGQEDQDLKRQLLLQGLAALPPPPTELRTLLICAECREVEAALIRAARASGIPQVLDAAPTPS